MKKKVLTLALCLIGTLSFAQAPAIQWQKCLGGTDNDDANCLQLTHDGGYIVAGGTYSNNGDVTGNHGGGDAWVAKLSTTGFLVWKKTLGGTSYEDANSVQPTFDGGYIVAGSTQSNNGDVTGNHGINDAWIVKLTSTGAIEWQKTLGGTESDFANSIQPTSDGGYIIAGSTQSNNGDVIGNHGINDAWIVKLTSTGAIEWQKTLGGTESDFANSILSTPDGGYIVAGQTSSNNGDVTGFRGVADALIIKLSATGSIEWQKCLGGTDADVFFSMQFTSDGGFIAAGLTESNNGDVTGNLGSSEAWIVKLTATGAIEWQKTLGGTSYENAYSIQPTTDGGYIVAGYTDSNNGDVIGIHGVDLDAWIVKLSAMGFIEWQKCLGGTGYDFAHSIQTTPDGGYIVAGHTSSNNGDVVTGYHGGGDVWVVKLEPELMATTNFALQELKIFPNPAKNILQLQSTTNGILDKITITDLTGKIFLTQTTNTAQINVEPLASGMYILEATSGENKFSSKFVKE